MGCVPFSAKKALTRLKGQLPKNPRAADSGEGCAEV